MDERKKRVLNAIINDYIATAEPVGSRTITKRYDLGVSPATIRNEMSDLTEEGYIEQPHTSSGRAPTAKGYRFYVDNLMARERLTPAQMRQIREMMSNGSSELDDFMRSCCNMISRLTNYTAIAAIPEHGRGRVENLQLVAVNERQVLAILLTSSGIIRHRLIDLTMPITRQQLAGMEQELQNLLIGEDVSRIGYDWLREMLREMQQRDNMQAASLDALARILNVNSGHRVFTGGKMNMLSQPEFQDIDKLKNVFSLLEAEEKVQELLRTSPADPDQITVAIGGEIPVEGAQDCSMVVANYFVNGERAGSIGVLGPTRMSYGKTVSLMEQIAAELGRTLSDKDNK